MSYAHCLALKGSERNIADLLARDEEPDLPARSREMARGPIFMMDANKYAYRIIWSEEDKEFVGLCAEFPSLSRLAKDQESALHGIVEMVKDAIADMKQNGEEIPEPIPLRHYSGHFIVRTTPDVHRQLTLPGQCVSHDHAKA